MVLSDMAVRRAKATGKAYDLYDTLGLYLAVTANGGKNWHFRYYWLGKRKRMSFGTYPEVSLLEARVLRNAARALVAKGFNPRVHRKQKRAAAELAGEHTFEAVYKQWFAHRELSLKKGRQCTSSTLPRIFDKDVLPLLGKRSIYEIKRPDLLEVIARIERRRVLSVAEKVRTWFNQMFRYALAVVPELEYNPFPRMPDLPKLLQRLRKYRGRLQTQLGLRFLLLTGVRAVGVVDALKLADLTAAGVMAGYFGLTLEQLAGRDYTHTQRVSARVHAMVDGSATRGMASCGKRPVPSNGWRARACRLARYDCCSGSSSSLWSWCCCTRRSGWHCCSCSQ